MESTVRRHLVTVRLNDIEYENVYMRKPDIIAPQTEDDTDEGEVDFSEASDDDDEE